MHLKFKKICFSLCLILLGASSSSWASTPNTSSLVPIFRSPESYFASGEALQSELKAKKVNTAVKQWQKIGWSKYDFWVPEEHFLQPLELSTKLKIMAKSPVLESPFGFNKVVARVEAGSEVRALGHRDDWVQIFIQSKEKGTVGWIPSFFVEPLNEDRGFTYTRFNSYLFQHPSGSSKVLAPIPLATRLEPLEWSKDWIKVQFGKHSGYVSLNHLVSRANFAERVKIKGKWHKVSSVTMPEIQIAKSKKKINILEVEAFKSKPLSEGMILSRNMIGYKEPDYQSTKLKLPTKILGDSARVLEYRYQSWFMSLTAPHGPVWWSLNEDDAKSTKKSPTSEVLKKPIYSLATHPKSDDQALISAGGIFLTFNGDEWEHLPQFKDRNYPVAIDNSGRLFVGDQWSKDKGKTFHPYIRWDKLTSTIAKKLKTTPELISLSKVEPVESSTNLRLTLSTGGSTLIIQGSPEKTDWQVIQ